ncbi:hypothetical protein LXL04_036987 [Taraxacum kok-saghyz]
MTTGLPVRCTGFMYPREVELQGSIPAKPRNGYLLNMPHVGKIFPGIPMGAGFARSAELEPGVLVKYSSRLPLISFAGSKKNMMWRAMAGAGTSKEEGAVKKLEEQLGILQIQNASHGTDIREINHRIETIVIQQEEMRLTNEDVGRSLAKILEKLERNEERVTVTPNSGLVTPPGVFPNRGKGVEGGGTAGSIPSGMNFSFSGKNSGGNGVPSGSEGEIPRSMGRRNPEPINVGLGFNHGGGFVYEGGKSGRYEYRHRKVDMPAFNGTDPDGWILQAERYFAIYQLINEEKLEAAILSLSGDALAWYRWSDKQQAITTWERMKLLFLKRFRSIQGGDLYEQWSSLEQTGTTAEYVRRFIELSAPLERVTDRIAIGSFIKGLKPNIRNELRIWAPQDLGRAMDLAQQIEEKNRSIRNSGFGALGYRPTQSLTRPTSNLNQSGNTGVIPGNTYRRGQGTDRPLTEAQIQDKRARGLCYKCDEKWQRNHRCKFQVNVILVEEEEEEEDEGGAELPPEDGPAAILEAAEMDEPIEISLNSVAGLTSPKTMKLRGRVMEQPVVTLIDLGATHNFISSKLVEDLQIPVLETEGYNIRMGTGDKEPGRGICKGVLLQLQELDIIEEFLPLRETRPWEKPSSPCELWSGKSAGKGQGVLIELNEVETEEGKDREVPEFLREALRSFKGLFSEPTGMPPKRNQEHQIILKDGTVPISVRPYRYPHFQKEEIERLIKEMLAARVIQASNSPYSSPVILVKKKDGSWRFCVDYRALNRATVPDKFPIPVIDELLDELHGSVIFSKLDLRSGYHQIRVKTEDVLKTAFRTHDGHYEFKVMPFGLTNAPATFQSVMNDVFRPHLRKFILVFFDDILIYSSSQEKHIGHLIIALKLLQEHCLYLNFKKCEFGQTRLSYLGHEVSSEGVSAEGNKIRAMTEWPTPRNLKGLRGFLGLTGYYRKFVQGYAKIASPLTDQLKKDKFGWNESAEAAFQQLKTAMTTVPVLAMPNFSKTFIVETDASGYGLGAVLSQDSRPIAYYSCVLGTKARLKSIYEKELMAIVKAVLKWRPYLMGRRFIVRTDQLSLKFLLEQRMVGSDYQKWVSKLMGFEFDIQFRTGSSNKVADALSRKETEPEFSNVEMGFWKFWDKLKEELKQDEFINKIKAELEADSGSQQGFSVFQVGNLLYKKRLVIPAKSALIPEIISEFHNSPIGGHSGEKKTYQRAVLEVYWVGMRRDIVDHIRKCVVCTQHKSLTSAPAGLLQPIPLPTRLWEEITMDFIEGLPKSEGWNVILVVVDRLSKYGHFIPLRHPFTAATVANSFMKEIVRLHGMPSSIISDRDKIFTSHFWLEMFRLHGVQLKKSTAYHPQTDGQTEVVNRCLETYLRCFCSEKPKSWYRWLSWAEFWYNTSYHTSTKCTPFRALYGHDPPPIIRYEGQGTSVDAIDLLLEDRDAILDDLRMNLLRAQQKMKIQADKKRKEVEYQPGDMVYLKIKPYRQQSLAKRRFEKLAARYYGPYRINQQIGKVAYKLELPDTATIHPVFHVSQLKTAHGVPNFPTELPPQLNRELEMMVQPEQIMGMRSKKDGNEDVLEVLVAWQGLAESEATWEDLEKMKQAFPNHNLEDKVKIWAAGVDKPPITRVYSRRGIQETIMGEERLTCKVMKTESYGDREEDSNSWR